MFGKLTVNTGSMYSGKSSELLRQGERHLLAGHKVVFIKPAIDLRYAKDEIVTHTGAKVEAIRVRGIDNIAGMAQVVEADVILIDEVQFFDSWLSICNCPTCFLSYCIRYPWGYLLEESSRNLK